MRAKFPAIARSLIRSGILAGATSLALVSDSAVHRISGLSLAFWTWPLYTCAALLLVSDLIRLFGRGQWVRPASILLPRLGYALVAYGAVSALSSLASQMENLPRYATTGKTLRPYFDHTALLGPWILALITLEGAYQIVAPRLAALSPASGAEAGPYKLATLPRSPLRSVVTNNLLAALTFLLLHPNGYVQLWWGLDLGVLQTPFYMFFGLRLASDLAAYCGRGLWRYFLSSLLFWIGLVQLAYFVLHGLEGVGALMTNTARYSDTGDIALPYLVAIGGLDVWVASLLGLIGIYKASAIYWKQAQYVAYQPMVQSITSLLLGGIVWAGLISLTPIGLLYSALGATAFGAFAAVSIGFLANYAKSHPQPLIARLSNWVAESPFRNANLGAFITFYGLVIRPALYTALVYAPLLEWGGVALLAILILHGSWGSVRENLSAMPPQPVVPSFERHNQEVSFVPDPTIEEALSAQRSFVIAMRRSPIIAYLVTTLWENGVSKEKIAGIIAPLVNHADPPQPVWSHFIRAFYPGLSASFEARSAQFRREVLRRTQESLEQLRPLLGGFHTNGLGSDNWNWAEDYFVETGDMSRLAIVVAVETWQSRGSRRLVIDSLDRLFQYRNARTRWYHLPSQRRRLVELNWTNRQNFVTDWQSRPR